MKKIKTTVRKLVWTIRDRAYREKIRRMWPEPIVFGPTHLILQVHFFNESRRAMLEDLNAITDELQKRLAEHIARERRNKKLMKFNHRRIFRRNDIAAIKIMGYTNDKQNSV